MLTTEIYNFILFILNLTPQNYIKLYNLLPYGDTYNVSPSNLPKLTIKKQSLMTLAYYMLYLVPMK